MDLKYEDLPVAVRDRIQSNLVWEKQPPKSEDFIKTIVEIADLHSGGLVKPSDLVFHEIWLDEDPRGRTVFVYGKKDSPHYFCEYNTGNVQQDQICPTTMN